MTKPKTVTEFYGVGNALEGVYTIDEKGNKNGPYERYRPDGQVWEKGAYNGKGWHVGPYEEYWENNQLKIKATCAEPGPTISPLDYQLAILKGHRIFVGPYESYHSHGQQFIKCTYNEKGKIVGGYESFHGNGQRWEKGTYNDDGERVGLWEEYDEDGQTKEKRIYDGKGNYVDMLKKEKTKPVDKAEEKDRECLLTRLGELSKKMKPSRLRKNAKRQLVAEFREKHPKRDQRD